MLSSLAREGSPVHRVQWVAASFPDDGEGLRSYLAAEGVPDAASACTASYDALLTDMDSHACAHDVVLAVQVRLTRSVEVGCATLAREVGSLVRLLADADVQVEAVLSADDLAHQLLRTYEPHVPRAPRRCRTTGRWPWRRAGRRCGWTAWCTPRSGWPNGRASRCAATSWRRILLGSARSTLAVVMEPLGPDSAVRKVEASRTADLADAELRRRGGFVSTARHARESEVLARREAELAEGHASFRYSGYVTVSAPSEEELVAACDVVQHAAGQSRLALRRLYGDQASAYTCTCRSAVGCIDARRAAPTMNPGRHVPMRARRRRAVRRRAGGPRNVVVLLLDSLNRHMLGSYGGTEFETPHLDRFARERAVRFTSHVTGSLPCMPARHDILCGSLDFLWRPWGSIEVWEEPITAAAPAGRRDDHAGLGSSAPLRDRRRELPHRLQRMGLRARARG